MSNFNWQITFLANFFFLICKITFCSSTGTLQCILELQPFSSTAAQPQHQTESHLMKPSCCFAAAEMERAQTLFGGQKKACVVHLVTVRTGKWTRRQTPDRANEMTKGFPRREEKYHAKSERL